MDLSLTPEQEMLKTAVRRFVQQEYPKETLLQIASPTEPTPDAPWQQLTQTGWLGILIPTEYGGEGGSFTDAGVLFEELGRGPVPGPHISSAVLAALTLLEGGTEEQKKDWLPRMATGEVRMVAAITEADYGWLESDVRLTAERNGDGYRLNGKKAYVYDGESATHLLCAARSEESNDVGLVIVPAGSPGISTRHLPGFAWNLSEIAFGDVPADSAQVLGGSFAGGWEALERAEAKTIPVLCAFQVGGSQAIYELSVDYSRTRHQFGTPIGRFQRVQDQVINLLNGLD
ncbi:MAG: acyl-CoA/acyl-ACP dehydrogenase, partial [Chloroflexi bacterium]|nr:acyl-CoA/acyl-ACP dehydrogenase [Chloroflexota bacterium]